MRRWNPARGTSAGPAKVLMQLALNHGIVRRLLGLPKDLVDPG
jgi:hypothetical protein